MPSVGAAVSTDWLRHDQILTVVLLKWMPSNEPLVIETEPDAEPLSDGAVSLLRVAKITGRVQVMSGRIVHGRGPAATAVILLRSPPTQAVTLRQPDRTVTLYVQDAQGFTTHPANAKTLGRVIKMWAEDDSVWCEVRTAGGGLASRRFRW